MLNIKVTIFALGVAACLIGAATQMVKATDWLEKKYRQPSAARRSRGSNAGVTL
jgi:hypothetical protein